jgi:hypothetical protein
MCWFPFIMCKKKKWQQSIYLSNTGIQAVERAGDNRVGLEFFYPRINVLHTTDDVK